ncbi:MAG: hypothetical protein RLZZ507_478 [Cyanobacteriota bacterium]|jgi:hypothetical protein
MQINMQIKKMQKVDYSERECVVIYNYIPRLIEKYAVLVNIADNYYHNHNSELLIIENSRGKYWVIMSDYDDHDIYWLFPVAKLNGRINPNENEAFNLLFDCHNYTNVNSLQFTLKKPAQVYPSGSGDGWILEKQGILDFSNSSSVEDSQDNGKITQNQPHIDNNPKTENSDILPSVLQSEFNEYIENSQAEFNQLNSKIQALIASHEQLKEEVKLVKDKYNDLAGKLSDRESINYQNQNHNQSHENSDLNSRLEMVQEVTKPTPTSVNLNLSPQEIQIVGVYNSNQVASISQKAKPVSEANSSIEKRSQGNNEAVVLEIQTQGYYWLLTTKDILYVMPRKHLNINRATIESLKVLFEYQTKATNKFKLLKPAKVVMIENTKTWQLTEKGIIEFE